MILNEPTRGIDVGVKQGVLQIIDDLTAIGVCVIIVSTETDELARSTDRVCVFGGVRLRDELRGTDINTERLRSIMGTATDSDVVKPVKPKGDVGNTPLAWVLQNGVWIWLVALFGMFNQFFLTVFNMQSIIVQATVLGMLGLAMCLLLLVA